MNGEMNISIYKITLSLLLSLYSPIYALFSFSPCISVYTRGGGERGNVKKYFSAGWAQEAFAQGWSLGWLYQSRSRYAFPCGNDYGLTLKEGRLA